MRIFHLLPLAVLVSLGQGAMIDYDVRKVSLGETHMVVQKAGYSKGRLADSLPSVSSDHFRLQNSLPRSSYPLRSSWTSLEWNY